MKLYIADAFTDTLFGGNPAGVVILEDGENFPSDEVMKKTAAELRYSETAFIKQLSSDEFNIRYFTPADEVDLCGHATIASFACLLEEGLVTDVGEYTNYTLAGKLNISINDGFIMMDMATPKYIKTISEPDELSELYEIMGISCLANQTRINGEILLPMIISTGLPDIIMPVPSRNVLDLISPDFEALSRLSEKYDVVGVHAFTLDCKPDVTAHCRNFAPLYDIDEEAATGTSNGALTYYLYRNGLLSFGNTSLFIQGEAMNRPSKIISSIENTGVDCKDSSSETISIRVGGTAKILANGTILL